MNIAILKGNVGQDPKVTNFKDGGKVAQFSLATTEHYRTKDGEDKSKTDWHNIVIRRTGLAGVAEKFVKKGTPLLIQGKIETRTYKDNSGQERYVTEVIAEEMELLGRKPESNYAPTDYPDNY